MLGVQGKHQNKPALPYVPGNELAGSCRGTWAKASPTSAVGDRIATGVSRGGFAEYALRPRPTLIPIPEQLPYAEATNFPTLYPTAYGGAEVEGRPSAGRSAAGARRRRRLGPRPRIEVGKAMGAVVIASAGGA